MDQYHATLHLQIQELSLIRNTQCLKKAKMSHWNFHIYCFWIFALNCITIIFAGSGELEFEEFCILAARFLIEEDEEQMRKELKEAFRFYDKEGKCTCPCQSRIYFMHKINSDKCQLTNHFNFKK